MGVRVRKPYNRPEPQKETLVKETSAKRKSKKSEATESSTSSTNP
jgi:hypothetical protein